MKLDKLLAVFFDENGNEVDIFKTCDGEFLVRKITQNFGQTFEYGVLGGAEAKTQYNKIVNSFQNSVQKGSSFHSECR